MNQKARKNSHPKKDLWLLVVVVGLATAMVITLATIATRGQRILGHDSFYYLENAKAFSKALPDHLGGCFPAGYPFLASLGIRAGMSPWVSLVGISLLSFALCACCVVTLVHRRNSFLWAAIVLALASIPAVYRYSLGVMSEMLFSSLVLMVGLFMARPDKRGSIILSVIFAIAAFCVRYAGGFLLAVLFAWVLVQRGDGLTRWSGLAPVLSLLIGAVVVVGLVYSNVAKTGYISGCPRGGGMSGLGSVFEHASNLGVSPIGLFSDGAVRLMVGVKSLKTAIGLGFLGLVVLTCTISYLRKSSNYSRPLALVIVGYLVSLIVYRSVAHFDNLSSGRFFIPVVFPLTIVIFELVALRWRKLMGFGTLLVITVGIYQAARGVSAETYGDVRSAVDILKRTTSQADTVLVNGAAASLAAYLDATVILSLHPPTDLRETHFVAVAARSLDRQGSRRQFEPTWLKIIEEELSRQRVRLLYRDDKAILLQRLPDTRS